MRPSVKFGIYWILLITSCFTAFVISALHMQVKALDFRAPIQGGYVQNSLPEVNLTAEAISVDPISRTIVMNWYPVLRDIDQICVTNGPEIVHDVFLPTELLDTSSPTWTAEPGAVIPAYRLNTTELCNGLTAPYPSFRTVTKLIDAKNYINVEEIRRQSTFQSYPFDVYLAPFSFYSQNKRTGEIRGVQISDAFGIAVNFEISLQTSFVVSSNLLESLQFYLRVERSMATKAFVIIVGITNWLTALAFLTIFAATLVYKPPKIYSELFVIPVGALFAFTSIRANFPGAPAGFGTTLDMFTILPVLIIMSFCSSSLLLIILFRRIHQEEKGKSDEEAPEELEIMNEDSETFSESVLQSNHHLTTSHSQLPFPPEITKTGARTNEDQWDDYHPICIG